MCAKGEQNGWAELGLEAQLGSGTQGRVNDEVNRMNWNEAKYKAVSPLSWYEWLSPRGGPPESIESRPHKYWSNWGHVDKSSTSWTLNFNVHTNYLGILLKWRFWFSSSGCVLRFCIPNKLPSDADTARTWLTFWAVLKRNCSGHLLKMARKTLFNGGERLNSMLNSAGAGRDL